MHSWYTKKNVESHRGKTVHLSDFKLHIRLIFCHACTVLDFNFFLENHVDLKHNFSWGHLSPHTGNRWTDVWTDFRNILEHPEIIYQKTTQFNLYSTQTGKINSSDQTY